VAELNGTVHTAEMAAGTKSQFDVLIDDELAFSKQREGRFPELSDILSKLA
jgi:predicted Rdx family selenoprotein